MRTVCALAGAFTVTALACGAASAGDYADRDILGFSPDGGTFAFEEYGVQDGSGFPYSSIYVIDTGTDNWVAGTPVHVLTHAELAPLAKTRAEARSKAQPILAARKVGLPGNLVASNPPTELSADSHRVVFLPRITMPLGGTAYDLSLGEITLPADNCPDMGQPFHGFRLTLTSATGGTHTLAEDSHDPVQPALPARLRHLRRADLLSGRRPAGARRHPVHVYRRLRRARPPFPGGGRTAAAVEPASGSIVKRAALC